MNKYMMLVLITCSSFSFALEVLSDLRPEEVASVCGVFIKLSKSERISESALNAIIGLVQLADEEGSGGEEMASFCAKRFVSSGLCPAEMADKVEQIFSDGARKLGAIISKRRNQKDENRTINRESREIFL